MVALDGSEASEESLPWARTLARSTQTELRLVTAQALPVAAAALDYPFPPQAYEWERRHCERYLAGLVHGMERWDFLPGPQPAATLLDAAQQSQTDLIVLTSVGHGRSSKWLIGSVAERVVRRSLCSVLVVPVGAKRGTDGVLLQRLLVPLDGSDFAARAVSPAEQLARQSGGKVHLLTVCVPPVSRENSLQTGPRQQLQNHCQRLQEAGVASELHIGFGEPARVILQRAKADAVDLLVLASHSRRGLERFWLGSVAERVIRHAPCATLIWKVRASD